MAWYDSKIKKLENLILDDDYFLKIQTLEKVGTTYKCYEDYEYLTSERSVGFSKIFNSNEVKYYYLDIDFSGKVTADRLYDTYKRIRKHQIQFKTPIALPKTRVYNDGYISGYTLTNTKFRNDIETFTTKINNFTISPDYDWGEDNSACGSIENQKDERFFNNGTDYESTKYTKSNTIKVVLTPNPDKEKSYKFSFYDKDQKVACNAHYLSNITSLNNYDSINFVTFIPYKDNSDKIYYVLCQFVRGANGSDDWNDSLQPKYRIKHQWEKLKLNLNNIEQYLVLNEQQFEKFIAKEYIKKTLRPADKSKTVKGYVRKEKETPDKNIVYLVDNKHYKFVDGVNTGEFIYDNILYDNKDIREDVFPGADKYKFPNIDQDAYLTIIQGNYCYDTTIDISQAASYEKSQIYAFEKLSNNSEIICESYKQIIPGTTSISYLQGAFICVDLLKTYGIGFILSDWIIYDSSEKKFKIHFEPDYLYNWFHDENGNIYDDLSSEMKSNIAANVAVESDKILPHSTLLNFSYRSHFSDSTYDAYLILKFNTRSISNDIWKPYAEINLENWNLVTYSRTFIGTQLKDFDLYNQLIPIYPNKDDNNLKFVTYYYNRMNNHKDNPMNKIQNYFSFGYINLDILDNIPEDEYIEPNFCCWYKETDTYLWRQNENAEKTPNVYRGTAYNSYNDNEYLIKHLIKKTNEYELLLPKYVIYNPNIEDIKVVPEYSKDYHYGKYIYWEGELEDGHPKIETPSTNKKYLVKVSKDYYDNNFYVWSYSTDWSKDQYTIKLKLKYEFINKVLPEQKTLYSYEKMDVIDNENEREDALSNNQGLYKTPNEYYSSLPNNTTTDYDDILNENDQFSNWFWLDSIRNWCLYTQIDNILYLNCWNGINGWDTLEKILNYKQSNSFYLLNKQYFYKKDFCSLGVKYPLPIFNTLISTYVPVRYGNGSVGEIHYQTIVLDKDTITKNYNTYMQNLHENKIYLNGERNEISNTKIGIYDETNIKNNLIPLTLDNQPLYYTVDESRRSIYGVSTQYCPTVFKTMNGQLSICYIFKCDTNGFNSDDLKPVISAKNANVVCREIFGDGSDKTINDWKNFSLVKNNYEEDTSIISTVNTETLYNRESLTLINGNTTINKMTLFANRPNPVTNTSIGDDFIERWDK